MEGAVRVNIVGAELPPSRLAEARSAGHSALRVSLGLYYGGEPLVVHEAPLTEDSPFVGVGDRVSRSIDLLAAPRWWQWVSLGLDIKQVPRETRLCVTLWAVGAQSKAARARVCAD